MFQEIWAKTQRELPPANPDRARPVLLHRRNDPEWSGWRGATLTREVDLAGLTQAQLPLPARRANLETAAFVDGWIADFRRSGRTVEQLRGSAHEKRLVLLLFGFWSTVRLAADGRKRSHPIESLPASAVEEIARWRSLSLGPVGDGGIDRLMAATFVRTPYQAVLDSRMIRGAVECHRVPPDGVVQMARYGGWPGRHESLSARVPAVPKG
ncbi:hypothetical protein [Kitasatospora kazusensis]|uniref:hypothetical protein n=1 Tax=Kitasatospora kazusensis TaxID=407974 RepID=UPI0031DA38E3